MDPIDAREAEIARIAQSKEDIAILRQHLKEIVEGPAFKGSHRSGQFLQYIIDQSIAGNFERLKERLIGVELFGRSPTYDTGEDAIVRVTASDVRKRLLQHYGRSGTSSEFRVSLPLGSYIPEIARDPRDVSNPRSSDEAKSVNAAEGQIAVPAQPNPATAPAESEALPVTDSHHAISRPDASNRRWFLLAAGLFIAVALTIGSLFWIRAPRAAATPNSVLPWSALFNASHATHLITSDPNIVVVQEITGSDLSLSDYANRRFIPDPDKLKPEIVRFCKTLLWGDNSAAAVDPPISASIGALAQNSSKKLEVRPARTIQLSDLRTDDNFIFLGSPRSNPWSALFSDQLDFRFVFDKATEQEIVYNAHPRAHESQNYVPTASGWATGQSYAIIAFVQNPDQAGQVLLLAGANGEGTEAAGELATNLSRLSAALQQCGIRSASPVQHFELLLRLNTMDGSPSRIDVLACHLLPGSAAH
jgi:hypothetical protein